MGWKYKSRATAIGDERKISTKTIKIFFLRVGEKRKTLIKKRL